MAQNQQHPLPAPPRETEPFPQYPQYQQPARFQQQQQPYPSQHRPQGSFDQGFQPSLPPPPPPHQQYSYPNYQQPQPQQQQQQRQQPQHQQKSRPKSRAFSFRSDKSEKSGGGSKKQDLTETPAEKEAKRLHSKADPTLAMNEAEPGKACSIRPVVLPAMASKCKC